MPNIEFNKVSFTYAARPTHNVLHNISFTINEGEKVAIIGQSGCGKSTILNLLLRFYNINSGSIKIGDIDITEFSLKYLRNLFALVPQDPVIFSTSVFENIKYGTENVSQEDVLQAAKDAEIFDFINNLPQGFSTFLGEKGVRISGGQKQRICVARALLKKPKILLLDEATSALDSENERMVQLTLDKIKGNVTIIVIAHKISTIANADKIILLDNGKISDIGSYNDLTKRSQLFQKLSNIM